jgi:hypothetical protein
MLTWLKMLFSEVVASGWWLLSAISTLSTFFVPGWSGKPRIALATSTLVGFAFANFRVFQKQHAHISDLERALAVHEQRISQLRVIADGGSRYILVPRGGVAHADFIGMFLEFRLMIENFGRRNSTIDDYSIEIVELRQAFQGIRPVEGKNGIHGRHCQHGLQPADILSRTGTIKVNAESATPHGTLLFFIPGIGLDGFATAGLHMQGDQRKFGNLRCRLTLTDTTHSSVTQEFELHED